MHVSVLTRLKLKDQIVLFNHLLEQQVQIYHKIQQQGWVPPTGIKLAGSAHWQPAQGWGPPLPAVPAGNRCYSAEDMTFVTAFNM